MRITTRLTDVIAEHGALLRGLIGQPVERAWAEWYGPRDDLHSWSPIVLCVGDRQVELWTVGPGEFGVTCDTLDLGRPPRDSIADRDDASGWVGDRPAPLRRVRGAVVRGVRLLAAGDLCAGIELAFDGWALTVWNDADDVGVTDEPLDFDACWVDVGEARDTATPTLSDLAAREAGIAARVGCSDGMTDGVRAEYAEVLAGYVALFRHAEAGIEALARAAFLIWYEVTEPPCFTGLGGLPASLIEATLAGLDDAAACDAVSRELAAMLGYYYFLTDFAFARGGPRPALARLLSSADPDAWRADVAAPSGRWSRGRMGDYWASVIGGP